MAQDHAVEAVLHLSVLLGLGLLGRHGYDVFVLGHGRPRTTDRVFGFFLFVAGDAGRRSSSDVESHLDLGRDFLARGQLQDALSHYHAAVGKRIVVMNSAHPFLLVRCFSLYRYCGAVKFKKKMLLFTCKLFASSTRRCSIYDF